MSAASVFSCTPHELPESEKSRFASYRLHGIESLGYLRDLFCLLPSWPNNRVLQLAPVNWKQALEQPGAQQVLARNVFRRVVLGL